MVNLRRAGTRSASSASIQISRFAGTRNEIGGYIDAAKKYRWQPVWAGAANATPSGKLTRECWETIRDMIVNAAKKAGKFMVYKGGKDDGKGTRSGFGHIGNKQVPRPKGAPPPHEIF